MKRTRKVIGGILGTGVMAGGGAMALSGLGASGANASLGLANLSAGLPAAGSIGGAGMVMGSLKGLRGIMRKRR